MVYGENVPDRDGRCAVSRDDYWGGLYAGPEDEEYDAEYDEEYEEDELAEEDELDDETCYDSAGDASSPVTRSLTEEDEEDYYTAEEELFDDELAMYYADRASFLDDMDRSSSDGWFYGDDY